MTTAPETAWPSSDLSCPDACGDAAAESAVRANIRSRFGRILLAALSQPEPADETAEECPTGA